MNPCGSHSQCRNDQACVNGICILGCRSNKDCPADRACINNKCQNPCEREGVCGPNAICSCKDHSTICKCPEGFEGNPTPEQGCVRVPNICLSTNECPSAHTCLDNLCQLPCSDGTSCAVGERCSDNICVKVCYADSNCLPGEVCLKGVCQLGCSIDSDCKPNQICVRNKCKCALGYTGGQYGCIDIDECIDQPCHSSARCTNVPGSFKCTCPAGTAGDPFIEPGCVIPNQCTRNSDCEDNLACRKGKCEDPCLDVTCGSNAVCNTFEHKSFCSCPTGFLGDPADINFGCFKVECLEDVDCPNDKFCDSSNNRCISKLFFV